MSKFILVRKFKKSVLSLFILSFLFHSIAFTTDTSIELDFKDSEVSHRLHTVIPLSNIRDISHLELDLNEQSVTVYKENKVVDCDVQNDTSSIVPRPLAINIPKEDVCHLPWHLGRQGLEYFLSQHTAWLIPLDENNYKLDLKGRLLGGGGSDGDYGDYGDYGGGYDYDSGDDGGDYDNYGRDNDHEGNYGGGSSQDNNRQCPAHYYAYNDNGQRQLHVNICGDDSQSNNMSDTGRGYGKSSNNSSDGDYGGNISSNSAFNQIFNNGNVNQPAAPASQAAADLFAGFFNNMGANQPVAPTPQANFDSFAEFFKNVVVNQPAAPTPQAAADLFAGLFNNMGANQPAAPASQPVANPFAGLFNNIGANQPATPTPQAAADLFAGLFNNTSANQPAAPTPQAAADLFAAFFNKAPAPEPVVEQPVTPTPAPVAEQSATPAPEPVVEQPAAPAPAPVAEQPAIPEPAPVVEQPATPEPVAEQPATPESTPVVEQPAAPAPEPVVEQPATPAPQPVSEQPVAPAPATPTPEPVVEQQAQQATQQEKIIETAKILENMNQEGLITQDLSDIQTFLSSYEPDQLETLLQQLKIFIEFSKSTAEQPTIPVSEPAIDQVTQREDTQVSLDQFLLQLVKFNVNNHNPMAPQDFFDLDGKIGGAGMGGGKPNWNRALGNNKGLASNPFEGKTPQQIDKIFRDKGFEPRGPDPINGKGGYVNPKTGRSYHIDEANRYNESPHIDVNRLKSYKGDLDKKKIPF